MVEASVIHEAFAELVRASQRERVPVGGRMSMGEPYGQATHLLVQGAQHCGRIRAGDVILFDGPGGWIAHRVIWVLPGPTFVTKGDANPAFDRPYPGPARLLGKVVGYAIDDTEHPMGPAGWHVVKGLWVWGWRAFLIRVLKREIRVEDLV